MMMQEMKLRLIEKGFIRNSGMDFYDSISDSQYEVYYRKVNDELIMVGVGEHRVLLVKNLEIRRSLWSISDLDWILKFYVG